MRKTNKKEFSVERLIKKKGDKLYDKWKGYDSSFNSWINKKEILYISEYFSGSKSLGGRVKVELDLSNYEKKADLKNVTSVYTSKFAKKVDLANLKSNADKSHINYINYIKVE